MVENYNLLATVDVLQFYEILQEVIAITIRMQDFYKLKDSVDPQRVIKEPEWLQIPDEQLLEIDNYYKKIKLLNSGSEDLKRTLKETLKMSQTSAYLEAYGNSNYRNGTTV
jgi:hypothetical protein